MNWLRRIYATGSADAMRSDLYNYSVQFISLSDFIMNFIQIIELTS